MRTNFILLIAILTLVTACSPVTPPPEKQAPEAIILVEVLQQLGGCTSTAGVVTAGNVYSFNCSVTADSGHAVSITRFGSEAAVLSQFNAQRGSEPVTCFHGYDLLLVSTVNPINPFIVQEQVTWQAGGWLIISQNVYDRGYASSNLLGVSEDVYASAVEHGLFPAGSCP